MVRRVIPDEGGLRLALGVAKVQNQRQVTVVDGDARDIDDARDALLLLYQYRDGIYWGGA